MSITELRVLLDSLEVVVRRKAIILELFPNKTLSQSQLADATGIALSNLSTYISDLKDQDIVEVRQGTNEEGYSVNLVQLKPRIRDMLYRVSILLPPPEKRPLPDLDSFSNILEKLMNPTVQKISADAVQILSRQYIIPYDSKFFSFFEKHMKEEEIRPVLVVLIKSARSIVGEISPEEKEKLLAKLGPKLQELVEERDSEALRGEVMNLLKDLGAYNTYEELKVLYLKQRSRGNDPSLFRSLILRDHREKLMDLWLSMMDLYESASEAEKKWFDQEFALLR